MKVFTIAAVFLIASIFTPDEPYKTVYFLSGDGVKVSADLYLSGEENDFIILLHEYRSSRGEYRETAKKIMNLGYNCLAVDMRSGGPSNDVPNLTVKNATQKSKSTAFIESKKDISAAINYVYNEFDKNSILLGSSYSASLALLEGKENPKVDAILAFSPLPYFKEEKMSIVESIKGLNKPTFLTGSMSEIGELEVMFEYIETDTKSFLIPSEEGAHGAKALLEETPNNWEYWDAVELFLSKL